MKVYCHVNPDNSVAIVSLPPEKIDDAVWVARALERTRLANGWAELPHEMDSADLPADRSQRDKWRHVGKKVVVTRDV